MLKFEEYFIKIIWQNYLIKQNWHLCESLINLHLKLISGGLEWHLLENIKNPIGTK